MSSSSWVKNFLVKKPDPPEMMDGSHSTSKISSPATSRKRLDPPEMMNGRLPSPTTVQEDITMDHDLLEQHGIPDRTRSAYDNALSLGAAAYNYLDDTTKRSDFERDTVALSMTFPFDFIIPTEEETTTTTTTTALTVVDCAKTDQCGNKQKKPPVVVPNEIVDSRKRETDDEPRNSIGSNKRTKEISHSHQSLVVENSIESVMDSSKQATLLSPADGMISDTIRCVPLEEPIFPLSVRECTEKTPTLPRRKQLVNYPQYCNEMVRNGERHCLMCGHLRLVVRNRGKEETVVPVIVTANRGICTACEVTVWKFLEYDLAVKLCHGPCRKFHPLAAFFGGTSNKQQRTLLQCCDRCRDRSREYASEIAATAVRKSEHPAKQWTPTMTLPPPICQICGEGESPHKQLSYFLPTAFDPEPTVFHVFCVKTAAILPVDQQPDLENLSKSGLKNEHGNGGPGVLIALQQGTVAENKNQREEVEGHLDYVKYQRDNREYVFQRSVDYPSEDLNNKPTADYFQPTIQNPPVDACTEEWKLSSNAITPANNVRATMNPSPQDRNPQYTTNNAYNISPPYYSWVRPVSHRGRLHRRRI